MSEHELKVLVYVLDGKWRGVMDAGPHVVERHGATPGEVIDRFHTWARDRRQLVSVTFAQPLGTEASEHGPQAAQSVEEV